MKLRSRTAALTAATAVLGLTALTGATPAAAAGGNYVALGDSYSSGAGAGSYESGSCEHSDNAYAKLWQSANSPSAFSFTACTGATTSTVLSDQLGPLSTGTSLVTLTVGGNDAGFADTMQACVLQGESVCLSKIDTARSYVDNTLPGQLDKVYDAIHDRAPNAHVVVLGYPHFYKIDGTCSVGISENSRSAVNGAVDEIDAVTAKRAAAHGFTFGDVRSTFSGHEICSGDSWLHSVTVPVEDSYHPTAAGQSGGYLPVLNAND
jgi:lysophospholipase L1-like esterase